MNKPATPEMELRDWFAGQALAAMDFQNFRERKSLEDRAEGLAEYCYVIADAMIAKRDERDEIPPR